MSFLLDPPLLVASGAVIERLGLEPRSQRVVSTATVATFVAVSGAMYANAPGLRPLWSPFGARSGREFMLTSGLAPVDERSITPARHALAVSVFLSYPLWLRLGRRLAHRSGALAGRLDQARPEAAATIARARRGSSVGRAHD